MDIKQFTRELLEGKPLDTAVVGTVTHAVRVTLYDPAFPPVWLIQHETNGAQYSDVCITRHEGLKEIRDGDQVMFHNIAPEQEGHPLFLYVSPVPVVKETPLQPAPPPPMIKRADLDKDEVALQSNYDFDKPDPTTPFNAAGKDEISQGHLDLTN